MTLFKRSLELQQQLRGQLDGLAGPSDASATLEQSATLDGVAAQISKLGTEVAKMKAKAQETDPDKKVYGKGMAEKILSLAANFEKLEADATARKAQLQPLVDAERQRQQDAAAAAQREQEEQQRRDAEAAARKAQEEERKRQEAEAAAQEAARQNEARLVEAERKRRADLAAADQAAAQQRAAAAAEQQRLAEERKAEVLRKQQEELAARQEAQKAAAAKAAAERATAPRTPPYDANGALVHLHRGKAELDDILRQTGDRQLVVLDFSASWCGPCRMMEPVLQGWARELGPRVIFIKCDAEAPGNRALAASSGIRAFPTFHIYRGGRVVGQVQGADRGGLRALVDAEARLLAPLEGGPASSPAVALAKAMSALKGRVAPAAFQAAAQTLLAYVRNLVAHPEDPRYRRIKTSNARYKAAVGSQPHGAECMAALGFQPIMEASEEVLVLEHPSPELPRVKVLLEQAMALSQRSAAAAAPPPAAAPTPAAAATPPAAPAAATARQPPAAASGSPAGPAASPQVAQLLAQQLAMAFAQSQGPGQSPLGSSGGTSALVPPAAATAGSDAAPAQQQQTQHNQAGPPSGGEGGGGGSGAAASQPGTQQGDDKQDEELARAIQDSMDDAGT